MRDYQIHKRGRAPLIRELYSLGISEESIAPLVGVCETTVSKDIRDMGGPAAFPDRPTWPNAFAAALRRYSELTRKKRLVAEADSMCELERRKAEYSTEDAAMFAALETYLQVTDDDMEDVFGSVAATRDELLTLDVPRGMEGYRRLLRQIFGREALSEDQHHVRSYRSETNRPDWLKYLRAIYAESEPIPTSRPALIAAFAVWTVRQYRRRIRQAWPANAKDALDRVLLELDPTAGNIVRWRCGIGTEESEPMMAKWIGAHLKMTATKDSAIEMRALKKLQDPSVKAKLQPLADPSVELIERHFARDELLQALAPDVQPGAYTDAVDKAFLPVRHLRMSARLANALLIRRIEYVGELAQLTERDLCRFKNVGPLTIREANDLLGSLGFSLGMRLDQTVLSVLQSKKTVGQIGGPPRNHR